MTIALISDLFFGEQSEERLQRRLAEARAAGAVLAILPELPLDPWYPAREDSEDEESEGPGGRRYATLAEAAATAQIGVVGGAIIQDPATIKLATYLPGRFKDLPSPSDCRSVPTSTAQSDHKSWAQWEPSSSPCPAPPSPRPIPAGGWSFSRSRSRPRCLWPLSTVRGLSSMSRWGARRWWSLRTGKLFSKRQLRSASPLLTVERCDWPGPPTRATCRSEQISTPDPGERSKGAQPRPIVPQAAEARTCNSASMSVDELYRCGETRMFLSRKATSIRALASIRIMR